MKNTRKKKQSCSDNSCMNANAKNLWFIGIAVIGLTSLFCFALFSARPNPVPGQDPAQGVIAAGPGLQAAFQNPYSSGPSVNQGYPLQPALFANPNCATCPNFTQCFPPGTAGGAGQQVAFTNPNCATCPSLPQCFPPGTTGGAGQQVGFQSNFYGGRGGCAQTVALTQPITGPATAAPTILRDAIMPHEFRGVCENCHTIIPPNVPAIAANAQAPHEYRGLCSKCHTIK